MDNEFEQEIDEPMYEERERVGCPVVGYQDVNVSIPVTIKPFGEAGNARTQCLGSAVVTSGIERDQERTKGECKFTICQKLRVEVPVIFGARAEIGDAVVDCGCTESSKHCNTCE